LLQQGDLVIAHEVVVVGDAKDDDPFAAKGGGLVTGELGAMD
jgi:hypothetical protein